MQRSLGITCLWATSSKKKITEFTGLRFWEYRNRPTMIPQEFSLLIRSAANQIFF